MKTLREQMVEKLWRGRDPFAGFPVGLYPDTLPELGHGPHPYLLQAIDDTRAQMVVEIGVWKGASSIAMAKKMKQSGLQGVVIAIDTWLGSWDHWFNDWYPGLNFEFGQPMLMRTFMSNAIKTNTNDIILPMPLDSANALEVFKRSALPKIDVIHIDGAHDYRAVTSDLNAWWPMVRSGGWLVGDDYLHSGEWPEVRQAFDDFFRKEGLFPFEFVPGKCRIKKP